MFTLRPHEIVSDDSSHRETLWTSASLPEETRTCVFAAEAACSVLVQYRLDAAGAMVQLTRENRRGADVIYDTIDRQVVRLGMDDDDGWRAIQGHECLFIMLNDPWRAYPPADVDRHRWRTVAVEPDGERFIVRMP